MSQNRTGTPYRLFRQALEAHLKADPVLEAMLGRDEDGHRKIFNRRGKPTTKPRYVVWAILPADTPQGTYKDVKAIEPIIFQCSSWGYHGDEAWQLFEFVEDALDGMDELPEMGEYRLNSIIRMEVREIPDDTVNWVQVVATYRAVVTR